jgi:integrase
MKSLRHTHASTLLESNVHPKVVQERLGHSTITTTLDTYSHVAQGLQEAAAKAFDDAYAVKKPESQPAISDAD